MDDTAMFIWKNWKHMRMFSCNVDWSWSSLGASAPQSLGRPSLSNQSIVAQDEWESMGRGRTWPTVCRECACLRRRRTRTWKQSRQCFPWWRPCCPCQRHHRECLICTMWQPSRWQNETSCRWTTWRLAYCAMNYWMFPRVVVSTHQTKDQPWLLLLLCCYCAVVVVAVAVAVCV